MSDRTVHANYLNIEQVVRYDRGGKWYIELTGGVDEGARMHVGVREAAWRALELQEQGGVIFIGRPGGQTFDRLTRDAGECPK